MEIKDWKIDNKFFYFLLFTNLILILLSFLQFNSKLDISKLWFLLVFPILTAFFYITLAFHYYILNKGWFLSIPFILISYFFSATYIFNLVSSSLPTYQPTINDYFYIVGYLLPFYMTGFMIGGTIGYFLALPLTYPKIPQKEQILQNSITFELTEKIQEEKNALTKLFGLFVKKKFNYSYLKSIKKNVTIYKYNISFLRRFILIIVEENQITFFPFIKDGYKYDINFNILPYIHVLGKNVLNLNKKEPSTIVVSEFENFTKPNKLISTLKSIKNIRLNKNDLYCIGGLLFLFCILIYLFIIPNLQINLAINLDLIAILITLTSIIIGSVGIVISIMLLKKKQDKK